MGKLSIQGVFIGKAEDIGGGLRSAIDKQRVNHRLWLWPQGLGSDEQGDLRFHGGPERALHHYPAEHYAYWNERYPQVAWQAPGFGENLSSLGLDERQVCIGDVFRWGDTLLQVSQPRSPCYRLSRRWGMEHFPREVQDSGRCGWFYRVLKPGFASVENAFELVERRYPSLSVAQALVYFFHEPLERSGLQQLQQCPALSARWRDQAARRLASGRVEDWSARLLGQPLEGMSA
ncbi:MOSC domain-containing protein [Phytopseudomonas dryadis]|uniref:MOSC domain-containing protein n=1 Tax=Phytopseudomonas dryadis TaxID=2487520 RepID=A0A4Q9R1Z9_9GAMM|nr:MULTISPECIES: MOSC domain-containing protein [Pseudomonas]TBU92916.1 MOSC domain-containing protein [Pseudomonas dryadis]TBV04659.1 MOSC domain-containing protein [Pseudomonas dryadis]TBV17253.1 MOSC domain-containing protein [Pseudomonas sp. FRB 230]